MLEKQPLVSVIIPTYKRPDRLANAIHSVLNQTYHNVEVIVVDDNNPNTEERMRTETIMEQFSENAKVKYIRHECNKNGSAARNTGARSSNGEYLAFLDDDDEYLPHRLESMVTRLESLPREYALSYSRFVFRFPDGKEVKSTETREGGLLLEALMKQLNICFGSNNLIRKSAYDSIGGFDESFKRNQDHEFLIRLLQKYKLAYCDELGIVINVHTESRNISVEETLNHFVETFKPIVDTLSPDERHRFYKGVNLNLFVNYVRSEHSFTKACSLIIQGKITMFEAVKVLWQGSLKILKRKIG